MTLAADERSTEQRLYIDLLKRVLTRYGFEDGYGALDVDVQGSWTRRFVLRPIQRQLKARGLELVKRTTFSPEVRRDGRDRPAGAETCSASTVSSVASPTSLSAGCLVT